LREML